MASLTFALDEELKERMTKFAWVNWSVLVREVLIERERKFKEMIKRLNSEEEQELLRWSIDLGRRAKKGRFKKLLEELSSVERAKVT